MQVHIETERLIIRDMVLEDLEQIHRWRLYENPLSPTWNARWRSRADMESWLRRYERDNTRSIYAIALHSGEVIGRLSLRHILPKEHAVLGIALGRDWVGQGYGTEALQGFLPYYFKVLGFRVMRLDVAAPNRRAIRCYEKCGFVKVREQYRQATSSEARAFMRSPQYQETPEMLETRYGQYYLLFYDMEARAPIVEDQSDSEGRE